MRVSNVLKKVIEDSVRAKAQNKSQALFDKLTTESYFFCRKIDKLNENILQEFEIILNKQFDVFFEENKEIFLNSGYFDNYHISGKEDFIKYCCQLLKEEMNNIFHRCLDSENITIAKSKSKILDCHIEENIRNIIITLENDDNKENLKDLLDKVNFD